MHCIARSSYADLPPHFYALDSVAATARPVVARVNAAFCAELGIEAVAFGESLRRYLEPVADPPRPPTLAQAYAGHQFGQFVPSLGDGRAHLLGELVDAQGRRSDVQFKGSGRTFYSRGGDGRATLGAVLREYLLGECFHALGIPTTRGIAVLLTGERVPRGVSKPGAVLARVAASYVRVGTFQFYACRGDEDGVQRLADYAIARHDPDLVGTDDRYGAFLQRVMERQARLMAQWMSVGFIHGVMNTDNMAIAGETIDYGPCAFLDQYDAKKVFSSIDEHGRYAYGNQPNIAIWNLARLAETLLPLLAPEEPAAIERAHTVLAQFGPLYQAEYARLFGRKLGLLQATLVDLELISDLLALLSANGVDYTVFFRALCEVPVQGPRAVAVSALFADTAGFAAWVVRWQARLRVEPDATEGAARVMRASNPAYIARNHLVEAALLAAEVDDDWGPFDQLLAVLGSPFVERPEWARYSAAPSATEVVRQTYCGT